MNCRGAEARDEGSSQKNGASRDTFSRAPAPPHLHFDVLSSTNDEARDWGWQGAPHLSVVTATQQTAGRGRRGRTWISLPDRGLYASFVLRSAREADVRHYELSDVPRLTMLLALAAVATLNALTDLRATTKWPNDVLLQGRKIAGILCEAYQEPAALAGATGQERTLSFCVAGIGLNVNFEANELPARPVFPATSLRLETGRSFEMDEVLAVLRGHLTHLLARYDAGEWESLRAEWESQCAELGRAVTVREAAGKWSGTALATDSDGALLVGTSDGLRRVVTGELTYGDAAQTPFSL